MLPVDTHIKKTNLFLFFFFALVATTVVALAARRGRSRYKVWQTSRSVSMEAVFSCIRPQTDTSCSTVSQKGPHCHHQSFSSIHSEKKNKILSLPPSLSLSLSTLRGCCPIVCQRHIGRSQKFNSMLLGNISKYALSHQRRRTMRQSWHHSVRLIQPQLCFLWSYATGLPCLLINN